MGIQIPYQCIFKFNPHCFYNCFASGQWSYDPLSGFKNATTILHTLAQIVAKGGNLLLNCGTSFTHYSRVVVLEYPLNI